MTCIKKCLLKKLYGTQFLDNLIFNDEINNLKN